MVKILKSTDAFFTQVKADLKQGIVNGWIKYLLVVVISFAIANAFFLNSNVYTRSNLNQTGVSVGDCIIYFFQGLEEVIPDENKFIEIPVQFLLVNIILAIFIGNYPMKDLHGYGKLKLVRSRSRSEWWFSKCIWNIATVFTFYISLYVGIFLSVFLNISKLDTNIFLPNESVIRSVLRHWSSDPIDCNQLLIAAIILPIVTSIALSLFQMALAFLITPVISYMSVITIFIFSVYKMVWYMPGNFMMTFRNSVINSNGINIYSALIVDLIITFIAITVGCLYFRKYDILGEKGNM